MMRVYAIFLLFFGGRYWVRYLFASLLFATSLYIMTVGRAEESERLAYLAAPVPEARPIDEIRRDTAAKLQLAHLRANLDTSKTVQLGVGGKLVYALQDLDAPAGSKEVHAVIVISAAEEDAFALWAAQHTLDQTDAGLVMELDGRVRSLFGSGDASKTITRMGWTKTEGAFLFEPFLEPRHDALAAMKGDPAEAARFIFYIGAGFAALGALQGLWPRKAPAPKPASARKPRLTLSRRGQWILAILCMLATLAFLAHDYLSGRGPWLIALGILAPIGTALSQANRLAKRTQTDLAPLAKTLLEEEARTMAPMERRPAGGPIITAPSLMERFSPFLAHRQTLKWMPLFLVGGIGVLGSKLMTPAKPLANMGEGVNLTDALPLSAGSLSALAVTLAAAWAVQYFLRLRARAQVLTTDPWDRIARERLK